MNVVPCVSCVPWRAPWTRLRRLRRFTENPVCGTKFLNLSPIHARIGLFCARGAAAWSVIRPRPESLHRVCTARWIGSTRGEIEHRMTGLKVNWYGYLLVRDEPAVRCSLPSGRPSDPQFSLFAMHCAAGHPVEAVTKGDAFAGFDLEVSHFVVDRALERGERFLPWPTIGICTDVLKRRD